MIPPIIDPEMKLDPIMKLMGNSILSLIIRSILLFFVLFWIPIINNMNKQELKVKRKSNFLKVKYIFFN